MAAWAAIQIARVGGPFETYTPAPPRWTLDGINIDFFVGLGKTSDLNRDLLWNYVPEVIRQNEARAAAMEDRRISTNLAFPAVGHYELRIFTHVELDGVAFDQTSEPVKIEVKEPTGKDAEVWKIIDDDNGIAYFMQYREIPRSYDHRGDEKLKRFRSFIQGFLLANPDTVYSSRIKLALDCSKPAEQSPTFLSPLSAHPQPCN